MRRFASHRLFLSQERGVVKQHVVEIDKGRVTRVFPFNQEIESTSFLRGLLFLSLRDIHPELFVKRLNEALEAGESLMDAVSDDVVLCVDTDGMGGVCSSSPLFAYWLEGIHPSDFSLESALCLQKL